MHQQKSMEKLGDELKELEYITRGEDGVLKNKRWQIKVANKESKAYLSKSGSKCRKYDREGGKNEVTIVWECETNRRNLTKNNGKKKNRRNKIKMTTKNKIARWS